MASKSEEPKEHSFRLSNPPSREIREVQKRFDESASDEFSRWSEYWRHKHVIEDALSRKVFGTQVDARTKASLRALRESVESRLATVRHHHQVAGPPIFQMRPGLNIIGPPYDFGLHVALGSNTPAVMNSLGSGTFSVVATAPEGTNTFGSAGVGLFIVPSEPSKALSIRPYFQWEYIYSCESHGPPTAHSSGRISANVSGRMHTGSSKPFPGKDQHLWSAGSDAWNDAHGSDADIFRIPDSELVVSGFDFYTVSYSCQTSADANEFGFWWAVAYVRLHCRVPFIVVEQF